MAENHLRVGMSALSLWPWTRTPEGLLEAAEYLEYCGMGLQLTPMRGLTRVHLRHIRDTYGPDFVLSYEGAWDNDTSYRRALKKLFLYGDLLAFAGPLVFGDQAREQVSWFKSFFPDAVGIDTDEDGVVEISPKRSMTVADYCEHQAGVCVDLCHLHERGPNGRTIAPFMESFLIDLVQRGQVKVIQVQTRHRKVFKNFMYGSYVRDRTQLTKDLLSLRLVLDKVPVIGEFFPWYLWEAGPYFLPTIQKDIILRFKHRIERHLQPV